MMPTSRRARFGLIAGVAVLLVVAWAVWTWLPPRALSFAGGNDVDLAAYQGPSPVGVPRELRADDPAARGQYLARAADCVVCHTRQGGEPFAGGRAFKTPFGVIYSPNITADLQTGIGRWSDADFLRAVHEGIAKDGERLYPAFPYATYTLMADEDVLAIKAYLFSLPKVQSTPPANQLRFPFNQRWLMSAWAALYNPDERFRPRRDRSPEWNRGAYLAEALAHCGECHTPRTMTQALDNRRKFSGAITAGWHAFNITPDHGSGLGNWSDAELSQYLQSGHADGRGSANGPMEEEVSVALSTLTAGDLRALVVYLRSIPAVDAPTLSAVKRLAASESPRSMSGHVDARGKQIFAGACAGCHQWSGRSLLTDRATLVGSRTVNDPKAINVVQTLLAGADAREQDGAALMPAFGQAYSDTEIAAVANYVTARFGAAPSTLTAKDVENLRQITSP